MKFCKRWCAFLLVAVFMVTAVLPTSALSPAQTTLSLMSFNIRCLNGGDGGKTHWSARWEAVCDYINNSDADVLCMQEVVQTQADDLMMNLSDRYGYMYYPREDTPSPEGLMTVFDVNRFELLHNEVFWLSETPDEMSKGWGADYYRICVLTVLQDKESGLVFNVYNVHLDHQVAAAQVGGINLVLERMKLRPEGYDVVMGDFNVNNTNPVYTAISEKMIDCQATAPNADLGCTFNGWSNATAGKSIDFIFVDKEDANPRNFTICRDTWSDNEGSGYLYSDHYAVRSTVDFIDMPNLPTAEKIMEQIADLPEEIGLNDAWAVEEICNNLDFLSSGEHEKVTNLSVLEEAKAILANWTYGDLDGDTEIGANDALDALKYVVGKTQLSAAHKRVGDVDRNLKVDAGDALCILKKIVGKIDQFPVEEKVN